MTLPNANLTYLAMDASGPGAWLGQLCREGAAYVLLQGFPYTGFAELRDGVLSLPPGVQEPDASSWPQYWDLRIFDGMQEWHAWRTGDRWRYRHARRRDWPDLETIERTYVLWGSHSEFPGQQQRFRLDSEDRGMAVWLPAGPVEGLAPPVALNTLLRVDYEPETGLAGVVDAMLLGFQAAPTLK